MPHPYLAKYFLAFTESGLQDWGLGQLVCTFLDKCCSLSSCELPSMVEAGYEHSPWEHQKFNVIFPSLV